jgi:methylated-DNA-[protein]-cysteine S-methyltransferase
MKYDSTTTPFQRRVYDAAQRIPRGKVTTYALLAHAIGCGSPRAVGQALRRNRYAPTVPCHRVIASDLRMGGFGGATRGAKLREKIALLRAEGVRIHSCRLAERAQVFAFSAPPHRHAQEP